jgi:hypothetical protein
MCLALFLSLADARRAGTTLRKLQGHGIASLILTGGFAIEMHCMRIGEPILAPVPIDSSENRPANCPRLSPRFRIQMLTL